MSLQVINQTIQEMCGEIIERPLPKVETHWRQLGDESLLYEVVVCIAGSQMLFEMAVSIADHLRGRNLLHTTAISGNTKLLNKKIIQELSYPISVRFGDGTSRLVKPRFKNRLAKLISETISKIYGAGLTIKEILKNAPSSSDARKFLVANVCGFGPKQASLFLRRIGYCSELAVLDVHVLEYLKMAKGINFKTGALGKLSVYERIEGDFRDVAAHFGQSLGCLDLAMWITMRVAKQEAYI